MKNRSSSLALMAALLGLCAVVQAEYDWHWLPPKPLLLSPMGDDIRLTQNNGGRAMAYGAFQGEKAVIAYNQYEEAYVVGVFDGETQPWEHPNSDGPCTEDAPVVAVSFGATTPQKHVLWPSEDDEYEPRVAYADTDLVVNYQGTWPDLGYFTSASDDIPDMAIAVQHVGQHDYVCISYFRDPPSGEGIFRTYRDGNSGLWNGPVKIVTGEADGVSLAASDDQDNMFLGVHQEEDNVDHVRVFRSTDHGGTWSASPVFECEDAQQPCVATYGPVVAVVWVDPSEKIKCAWSKNGGDFGTWTTDDVPFSRGDYAAPSVCIIFCEEPEERYLVSIAAELTEDSQMWVSSTWGRIATNGGMTWSPWTEHWISSRYPWGPAVDDDANPCMGMCHGGFGIARALCVWTDDASFGNSSEYSDLYGSYADWKYRYPNNVEVPPAQSDGTGRRILPIDGMTYYAAREGANIDCGVAREDGFLEPVLLSCGTLSALAADAEGIIWACFLRDDSVWCRTGTGSYEMVYAGSSSAVPGQPSIVCYPDQASGVYVGNVVFAVYDTSGGNSMVMYARVDTTGVVLDTIESAANLRDSLPSISVFEGDTLLCVYQHGDSVLSRLLADYGPSTQGQPPTWSSPSLVTASGYHPMSVMENGCVLNCNYTQQSGGYSIQRATCDLSGGGSMFGNWVAMTPPSATSNVDKGNPVYAGVGCSVWQQMSGSGKWTIKAFVRGEETTLVANDTDAYHPHAVAESSGSTPSTDLIRLHLLYDAGVAFEVDSGVFDTGQVRYAQFDFPVSHAGSDATRANNGSKLMRKEGGDSLFAAYQDADGTVMYAWSAAGDSWQREIVATERGYPAIAADSTGKRWVVAQTGGGSMPMAQYLYYQSGGSWTPQTLYSIFAPLGPASLAGASSTTTGIAYAAFRVVGVPELIVLTKFDGTNVAACTVATGSGLGDPAVTVEPYTADSDYVHVTWEDAGVIKYRMDTDGRSSAIANNWTAVVTLSDVQATSHHPVISADRDRVVAAWAQGATAEIYARQRSTDSAYNNWESAVNLSNTANDASDWPTIALGDTVVVAWEETRSAYDHDILACIDFGDTLNVADNATVSSYPHVLFQNKVSGDSMIPYLHTIWSETPEAEYYEVRYDKLNLKQSSGEGQQSASSTPIPAKASLAACRPNPFRDRTQINYALPTAGNVSLRVYDATGRTVRKLASGHQKAGSYSVTWDSKDNRGRQVPRGVYFYRLETPGFRSVKKAVVTR